MNKKFIFLQLIFLLGIISVTAQNEKPDRWTPKDIINTEYLRSSSFSPDNQMIVWTKRRGVKEKDRFVSDIYLTRFDMEKDGQFRTFRLTNQDENDSSPFFSKDGESIYFLSSRKEGKKLWSMSIFGGEPEKVHEFKDGISNIQWKNDSTVLFVSNDGKSLYDQELKKKKDNVIVVEDEEHWTIRKVYAFDLKKKKITRMSDNDFPVSSYAVSKDGNWLAYSTTQSRHYSSDAHPKPKHYLKDLNSGETVEILQGVHSPGSFQFTADNEGFYFSSSKSNDEKWEGAGIGELNYFKLSDKSHQKIRLDWEWGMSGGYRVIGNDALVNLANGAVRSLGFYAKADNWTRKDVDFGDKTDHVSVLAFSEDGKKVIYDHSTASKLPKYYVGDFDKGVFSNEKEVTKLNKKLKKKAITKSEVMKWKGWKGEEVTGILYYPENYEEGKRYPLMLSIHGGPAAADTDRWSERWSTYPNILAQRGAFVLKPNYHGSGNHGLEFVESIAQNYYEPEMEDITKGLAVLDGKGMIDMDKLGVMGWSNGAIIATMLTVRFPDMFKVACPGAGDVNWTSDYGTCRFGVQFDQHYFGGAPWDDVDGKFYNENYIIKSPLFELEKVKTPTIIFHGSEDRAVPRDQGWEYYRALQQAGQTQVRFLWFPGQPHGLGKITHQLRKMNEEIAWIDKYLFGKEEEKDESLKKESPLAMLLKQNDYPAYKGSYGVWENNILLPEVVEVAEDSISIGRFEVTNAQFRMFDFKHEVPAGAVNHPVIVPYKRVQAYLSWLNEKTGATYRLPTEEEAKNFQKKAEKIASKENTLNLWAGYELNLKDAQALQAKIEGKEASLLKGVGQFKATKIGDAEVYDLGGNAAEYYGTGQETYGYGAGDYVDGKGGKPETSKAYRGFRVVKE